MNRIALALMLSLGLLTALRSASGHRTAKPPVVRPASSPEERKETERRIRARDFRLELDAVDEQTASALRLQPRGNAPPLHRELFAAVRKDAGELMQIDLSLRKWLAELDRRELTDQETAEYTRLREQWRRQGSTMKVSREQYDAAIRPIVEAEMRAKLAAEAKRLENEDLGVSMKAYLKIQDGQDLYQVKTIIGWDVSPTEHSAIGSHKTYSWGKGFHKIICTFEDGSVVGKSQLGL